MSDTGNMRSIADLLAGIGIAGVREQDAITTTLEDALRECGVSASVAGIRWGRVTLEADAVNAARISWQMESLQELLSRISGGSVNRIRVRVTSDTPTSDGTSV